MSRTHRSTLRHRLGVALLATGLAGGMVVTAAPAQALPSQVCVVWSYSSWDDNGTWVSSARCALWWSTGGDVIKEPETSEGDGIPKGASPSGTETKEVHCAFLNRELASERAALRWAQGGIQAADDELDRLNFKSAVDHAAYVAAHEAYESAVVALEESKAHYQEETDTELEYETRNGNTVVKRLAVDPKRPWGEEVIAAQDQLDRTGAAERAAWDRWSRNSDPAARAAQQRYDAMNEVLATAPMHIEALQRELADAC